MNKYEITKSCSSFNAYSSRMCTLYQLLLG